MSKTLEQIADRLLIEALAAGMKARINEAIAAGATAQQILARIPKGVLHDAVAAYIASVTAQEVTP